MNNILHIISSPRGNESFSIKLGNAITGQLTQNNPGASVTELNLSIEPFPHLDELQIRALRTPEDQLTLAQREILTRSDKAIAQLREADALVISVPFFNFGVPSTLKSWIDNVVRAGHTFSYDQNGPKGLVTGKKVYLAIATGGVYSDGPAKGFDFAIPYLTTVLGFIGLTDVEVIRAEGTAIPALQEQSLEKAIESINV